jgi:hypothetical protein
MVKQYILSLALIVASLHANSAFPAFAPRTKVKIQFFATKNANDDRSLPAGPLDPVNIDIARAIDCAEHFGKCSTDEMEELRDGT